MVSLGMIPVTHVAAADVIVEVLVSVLHRTVLYVARTLMEIF